MWIFTKDGFLSIVQHNDKPDILIVRSRFKGHIERIFGHAAPKVDTTGKDYEYRAEIPKEKVAMVMSDMIKDIYYGNFKNEICNKMDQLDKTYVQRCFQTYEVMQKLRV
jgi:hypothetical protein